MFFWGSSGTGYNPDRDMPDLSGKVITVTGGNTGLGKESCLQFVKHNAAQVWLAARDAQKAQAAIADIQREAPASRTQLAHLPLDLTSFDSIAAAAATFTAASDRLDILVNNAGIMAAPPGLTREGYEIQFGTNHLGHALLTKLLLPTLLRTAAGGGAAGQEAQQPADQEDGEKRQQPRIGAADVRIVTVSSMGHKMAPAGGIQFERLRDADAPWSTWQRYGQSKLANVLFTAELARRYTKQGLTAVAVHPGVIRTELTRSYYAAWPILRFGDALIGRYVFQNIPTGTQNQLWAATAPLSGTATSATDGTTAAAAAAATVESGAYYVPVGRRDLASKLARDADLARRLWDWTESELAKHGY